MEFAPWPGSPGRLQRATFDGRDLIGQLKYDSSEITWSGGDVWTRALPGRREPAPLPEAVAPEDCVVTAHERMGRAEANVSEDASEDASAYKESREHNEELSWRRPPKGPKTEGQGGDQS